MLGTSNFGSKENEPGTLVFLKKEVLIAVWVVTTKSNFASPSISPSVISVDPPPTAGLPGAVTNNIWDANEMVPGVLVLRKSDTE